MRKLPLPAFLLIALTSLYSCHKDDLPHTAPYVYTPPPPHQLVSIPAYYGTYYATDSVYLLDSTNHWVFYHVFVRTITGYGNTPVDSVFHFDETTTWENIFYSNQTSSWFPAGYWHVYPGGDFANRRSVNFSFTTTTFNSSMTGPIGAFVNGTMELYNDTTFYTAYNDNDWRYHRIHSGHLQ